MTVPDLVEVSLGPGARGVFTTTGTAPGRAQAPAAAGDPGFNLAAHVGDDPDRVAARRRELEEALGTRVAWMRQVHSTVVAPAAPGQEPTADALVADLRGRGPLAAGVLTADCVPLLLASADGRLLAAVHAGRRGMCEGVVDAALGEMARLGAAVPDILAVLGPSICGACYEVPEAMRAQVAAREPDCASRTRWGTPAIDVAAGVRAQLRRAGVRHITDVSICTYEDERFYSYRRQGDVGRLGGVVLPVF